MKPDWCPQGVWDAANLAWNDTTTSGREMVARAIIAERERCAVVAEAMAADRRARESAWGFDASTATPIANQYWCEEIAAEIRGAA
jgi:hypothetical protein